MDFENNNDKRSSFGRGPGASLDRRARGGSFENVLRARTGNLNSTLKRIKRNQGDKKVKVKRLSLKPIPQPKTSITVNETMVDYGYYISAEGYFYAAKSGGKVLSSNRNAIQLSGGVTVSYVTEVKVQNQGKGTLGKHKIRKVLLGDGMLNFYSTACPDVKIEEEEGNKRHLFNNETIMIQLIHMIRMNPLHGNQCAVYLEKWVNKKKRALTGKSLSRLKNAFKKTSKTKDEKKKSRGNFFKRSLSSSRIQIEESSTTLSGEIDESSEDGEVIEENVAYAPLKNKSEEIVLLFSSHNEAEDFVKHLLIEVGNQVMLLRAYADILDKNDHNLESQTQIRRSVADLSNLAYGYNSKVSCKAREKLADCLFEAGDVQEANMWYELAHFAENKETRDTMVSNHKVPSVNDTFFQLSEFLKLHGRQNIDADEQARILFEHKSPAEIARQLYLQYKCLPVDWKSHLTESAKEVSVSNLHSGAQELREKIVREHTLSLIRK